jgi:hypothetical protein
VTKARLISLLMLAVFIAMILGKFGILLHSGGFNDGGYW